MAHQVGHEDHLNDLGIESKASNFELGDNISQVFGLDSENSGRAVVDVGRCKRTGEKVAIKRFFIDEASEEAMKLIRHEVVSMRQLRHANILPCLASFSSSDSMQVWLVTPLMQRGSVRNIIDTHFADGLPEPAAATIIKDTIQALIHLHERGIVHRAIKASHILVDGRGRAKLTGLRYSCSLYETSSEASTTAATGGILQDRYDYPLYLANKNINWMSPELLQQNVMGYNEKSDIYSLGVTSCEIANGLVPFSEMPGTLMLLEKLRGSSPKLLDMSTVEEQPTNVSAAADKPADSGVGASVGSCSNFPKNSAFARRKFSDSFHELVGLCCSREAESRPSAAILAHHPFVKHAKQSHAVTLTSDISSKFSRVESDDDDCGLALEVDARMNIDDFEWDFGA